VDKTKWDADANVWRIEMSDVRTGEKRLSCVTALVSAIGVLVAPRIPKLEGMDLRERRSIRRAGGTTSTSAERRRSDGETP